MAEKQQFGGVFQILLRVGHVQEVESTQPTDGIVGEALIGVSHRGGVGICWSIAPPLLASVETYCAAAAVKFASCA
ncbi:MAG: hypothetical protein U5N53_20600 [Mycobacterium sp.]|nr:hypothetical protein [Mycobacterium sp.]